MLPEIARFFTKNTSLKLIILALIGKGILSYRGQKMVRRPLAMAGHSKNRQSIPNHSDSLIFEANQHMKNPKKFTHLYQLEKYFK